jgi:dTDP-4-amino-4,6-dideoxygalactose transaminase
MQTQLIKIPYVNIAGQHSSIKSELLEAIAGVIERGEFILGNEVDGFERRFAQMCGVRFAVGVNSGTDALILALRALGIGPGDEVITVPNSFIASTSCIIMVGAQPIFVDVRDDYNMDPRQIEQAITPKTKAILPVHLTGSPADMDPILEVSKRYGLYVVEDCAQAVLAEYKGRYVGSFGNIGCFSLHPLKTLNACGDGGVLTTNDEELYERLRLLRNLGLRTREECVLWSGNSRLDTLQAAILLVKLKYLNAWTERRRAIAAFYQKELVGISGLRLPLPREFEKPVYHTFVVYAEKRDELKQYLADNGIESAVHYPVPIHLQRVAKDFGYEKGSLPVAERQAKHILSLPVYPELKEIDLEYIVQTIRRFYQA